MWQHTDFPVSLWWLSRPDRGWWPWWTVALPSFSCIGDDTDLIISECAVQTWAINPLVEPPTHANFFWQNLHFALQEVGFSKYCQHEDSFTLFTIVVDSLCNDYVSAGSIYILSVFTWAEILLFLMLRVTFTVEMCRSTVLLCCLQQ